MGGKLVEEEPDGVKMRPGTYQNFEDDMGEALMRKYPFLINKEEYRFSPDAHKFEKEKREKPKSIIKKIWQKITQTK